MSYLLLRHGAESLSATTAWATRRRRTTTTTTTTTGLTRGTLLLEWRRCRTAALCRGCSCPPAPPWQRRSLTGSLEGRVRRWSAVSAAVRAVFVPAAAAAYRAPWLAANQAGHSFVPTATGATGGASLTSERCRNSRADGESDSDTVGESRSRHNAGDTATSMFNRGGPTSPDCRAAKQTAPGCDVASDPARGRQKPLGKAIFRATRACAVGREAGIPLIPGVVDTAVDTAIFFFNGATQLWLSNSYSILRFVPDGKHPAWTGLDHTDACYPPTLHVEKWKPTHAARRGRTRTVGQRNRLCKGPTKHRRNV